MKKIMFNDKFLLTQAVLDGRKTQTRRIIKSSDAFERVNPDFDWDREDIKNWENSFTLTVQNMSEEEKKNCFDYLLAHPKYKVGEVVAVAQSYETSWQETSWQENASDYHNPYFLKGLPGWKNKMFVAARDMPHQIRITAVRVERLQDISDVECLKEGIQKMLTGCEYYQYSFYDNDKGLWNNYKTPREAFARLINKVSKKDVWSENPYMFVYDFELVK